MGDIVTTERIQVRRDATSDWVSASPTPSSGEPCWSEDAPFLLKVGNGSDTWPNLPAVSSWVDVRTESSGPVTLGTEDHLLIITGSSSFTVNLPTAVGITGRIYQVKNAGTGYVTLDAATTELIDANPTWILDQYDAMTVVSDGTGWQIVSLFGAWS